MQAKWPTRLELSNLENFYSPWVEHLLVYCRISPSTKIAGTRLYTLIERGTVRGVLLKNTKQCPQPGFEPGPPNLEMSILVLRPPCLHQCLGSDVYLCNGGHKNQNQSVNFHWAEMRIYHTTLWAQSCPLYLSLYFRCCWNVSYGDESIWNVCL